MALYVSIFPYILWNSFDAHKLLLSENSSCIREYVPFGECKDILQTVIDLQRDHICVNFPIFSSDLIRSYLRYFSQNNLLVALVYVNTNGCMTEKFRVSTLPHVAGENMSC